MFCFGYVVARLEPMRLDIFRMYHIAGDTISEIGLAGEAAMQQLAIKVVLQHPCSPDDRFDVL